MFRHAISLDPGLHHGYSGAAQVLATLALLSPDESRASEYGREAAEMADKALDIAPSDAWPQAAQGWVLAVSGNLDQAYSFAQRAVKLAPGDGHILDLAGTTPIVTNHPEFAEEVSRPDRPRSGSGRFGANNIWGVSQLMLGHYTEVIEAFSIGAAERHADQCAHADISGRGIRLHGRRDGGGSHRRRVGCELARISRQSHRRENLQKRAGNRGRYSPAAGKVRLPGRLNVCRPATSHCYCGKPLQGNRWH